MMNKLTNVILSIITVLLMSNCKIEEPQLGYKVGDAVFINPDGARVVIDKIIPGGYVAFQATKYEVKYIIITDKDIIK